MKLKWTFMVRVYKTIMLDWTMGHILSGLKMEWTRSCSPSYFSCPLRLSFLGVAEGSYLGLVHLLSLMRTIQSTIARHGDVLTGSA